MRCYKLLLFLNLFVNVNPFIIRYSASCNNLYKLSRTSSKIFVPITTTLKKVPSSSILTNKCKTNNNQEELKSFIILICHNTIKFTIIYYILFKYFYHTI